ncbi:hypothetical protein SAMD00019534_041760 [Acytostelium subglobosum LB1]|uniref:hypothetical protein n=1 Tax=Acytostelium subglobosum LB1 TaxID=1410327 RepID=UPI000644D469|nr:hypothetical protein SAMD00019534_041760 [Acytostelium subglobosum LB1]GAM21001.1 hypothetical protein SAMD00019534_041760 [Acytostelium subglobosum LB1]|eukprot:XP_012756135.1 hypothetical protein SAMD00019534_041760 [Acytostelium subglobosum LB1]
MTRSTKELSNPFIGPRSDSFLNFPEFPTWTIAATHHRIKKRSAAAKPNSRRTSTNSSINTTSIPAAPVTPSSSSSTSHHEPNRKNIFNFTRLEQQQQQATQQQSIFNFTPSTAAATATPCWSTNQQQQQCKPPANSMFEWSIDTLATVLPVNITIDDDAEDFDDDSFYLDTSHDDSTNLFLQRWKQDDEFKSNQFFEKASIFEGSVCQKRKHDSSVNGSSSMSFDGFSSYDSDYDSGISTILEEDSPDNCSSLTSLMSANTLNGSNNTTNNSSRCRMSISSSLSSSSRPQPYINNNYNNMTNNTTFDLEDHLFLTPIVPNKRITHYGSTSTSSSASSSVTSSPCLTPASCTETPITKAFKYRPPVPVFPYNLPEISPIKCKQAPESRCMESPPTSPMKCWNSPNI